MLTLNTNVAQFNRTLKDYRKASGKTATEALVKQGGKLAWEMSRQFAKVKPDKGFITRERLAALAADEGITVRPSVRERVWRKNKAFSRISDRKLVFGARGRGVNRRGLNLQALAVRAELALRERGRGFLQFAARVKSLRHAGIASQVTSHLGRYGQFLAEARLRADEGSGTLTYQWGGRGKTAVGRAMSRFPLRIAAALAAVRADMLTYIRRKLREEANRRFA